MVVITSVKASVWCLCGTSLIREETRIFEVDNKEATIYNTLLKKIKTVFPDLKEHEFSLTWIDSEGDPITFSSDQELTLALRSCDEELLFISINVKGGPRLQKYQKCKFPPVGRRGNQAMMQRDGRSREEGGCTQDTCAGGVPGGYGQRTNGEQGPWYHRCHGGACGQAPREDPQFGPQRRLI